MKTTVDEISRFVNEGWPKPDGGWYMEDGEPGWEEHMDDESYNPLIPGTVVQDTEFECGIFHQGEGEDPTHGRGYRFTTLFRRWKKQQTVTILSIEIPKANEADCRAGIKRLGGKVLN